MSAENVLRTVSSWCHHHSVLKHGTWGEGWRMGGTYFDDEQEINPQGLAILRKVFANLFRGEAGDLDEDEKLSLAKELVALFKSGFRSEEELNALVKRSPLLTDDDG